MKIAAVVALVVASIAPARAQQQNWPDTYQSRLEILALLQTLNGELLTTTSATRTLESWCGEHHMAPEPNVVAVRVPGARKEPSADVLQRLAVANASEVAYRRVVLRCGVHVMSEADNWCVPARLTAEMNALLETTSTPFGKAVQPLHPYRRTISATMLWSPLQRGWELQPRPASHPQRRLALPAHVFEHRALLLTADNRPFCEVVETYRSDVLAFGR
jgi:chorismate-pyruvate lyase